MSRMSADDLLANDLHDCAAKFVRFAENWGVPTTPESLKMFLACALDVSMPQAGILEIGDDLWERYYQQILDAWEDSQPPPCGNPNCLANCDVCVAHYDGIHTPGIASET